MPTNIIKEKNTIKNDFRPLRMEVIEGLSKRTLDREIPFVTTTSLIDVYKDIFTENGFNTFLKYFNLFLKEYDNDTLIFNISLTSKNAYISSLNKRFASKENIAFCPSGEGIISEFKYCEYYINIIKNIPNDMIWVNELTSRELRCFQKNCFGEIIFKSSINRIQDDLIDDNGMLMKNIDCYVLHVPGLLYTPFKKDKCQKINFVETDLPYNLFNGYKI